jgi:hypothetical protein
LCCRTSCRQTKCCRTLCCRTSRCRTRGLPTLADIFESRSSHVSKPGRDGSFSGNPAVVIPDAPVGIGFPELSPGSRGRWTHSYVS